MTAPSHNNFIWVFKRRPEPASGRATSPFGSNNKPFHKLRRLSKLKSGLPETSPFPPHRAGRVGPTHTHTRFPQPDFGPKTRFPTFASISLKSFDFQWYHPMISSFGNNNKKTGASGSNTKQKEDTYWANRPPARTRFPHLDFGPKTRFPTFASISLKSFDFQWYHPMISSFGKTMKNGGNGSTTKQ